MTVRIRIGDVFDIPLPDGKHAYCQHILRSNELGFLVRVFDLISSEPVNVQTLLGRANLFPPVFVGLQATAHSGRWKRIGNLPVERFAHPKFRQSMGTKPGTYSDWRIWDGTKTKKIGALPENLRSLELKCVWGDEGLEERIVMGTYRGNRMY